MSPLAERELSDSNPRQALSDDLIFSYYAEGCTRDGMTIGYFPRPRSGPGWGWGAELAQPVPRGIMGELAAG